MNGKTLLFLGAGAVLGYMLGRGSWTWAALGAGAGYVAKQAV